jgi:hypothetical protein
VHGAAVPFAVDATLTGESPGRPPLRRFTVEVKLDNRASEPRWFLLPSKNNAAGGVDVLETFRVGDTFIGRFLGTGGFWAVRLLGGAQLTVANLPYELWSEDPGSSTVPYEVKAAAEITLGAEPIATWFGASSPSPGGKVDFARAQPQSPYRVADGKEVPVRGTFATSVVRLAVP